jgi:hypothetical protein
MLLEEERSQLFLMESELTAGDLQNFGKGLEKVNKLFSIIEEIRKSKIAGEDE